MVNILAGLISRSKVAEWWVGRASSEEVYLRLRVVQVGWLLVVTVAQHVHRHQCISEGPGAGLEP